MPFGAVEDSVVPHAQARAEPRSSYDSPGVPTPYRAMMRHLLGGDYHSPGGSEAWSPVRQTPAAGRQCESASEGSPATPAARLDGRQQQQQQQQQLSPGYEAPGSDDVTSPRGALVRRASPATSAPQISDAEHQVPVTTGASTCAGLAESLVPAAGDAEAPSSAAQCEEAPVGAASGMPAADEDSAEPPPAGPDPSIVSGATAPQQTAAGAAETAPQPLSAIPARLHNRAVLMTPNAAESPGAWALVRSPGSELDTPTAGAPARPRFAAHGTTHRHLFCPAC